MHKIIRYCKRLLFHDFVSVFSCPNLALAKTSCFGFRNGLKNREIDDFKVYGLSKGHSYFNHCPNC